MRPYLKGSNPFYSVSKPLLSWVWIRIEVAGSDSQEIGSDLKRPEKLGQDENIHPRFSLNVSLYVLRLYPKRDPPPPHFFYRRYDPDPVSLDPDPQPCCAGLVALSVGFEKD